MDWAQYVAATGEQLRAGVTEYRTMRIEEQRLRGRAKALSVSIKALRDLLRSLGADPDATASPAHRALHRIGHLHSKSVGCTKSYCQRGVPFWGVAVCAERKPYPNLGNYPLEGSIHSGGDANAAIIDGVV